MRLFLGITPTTWTNRTRSQMRKTKLLFNCVASVMIFQNCGGRRGAQFESSLKSCNSWKILSTLCEIWVQPPVIKLDSSKQRDTSKNTSPEALLWQLYSYALLNQSQIPNCYQQLSQGFAVLLNCSLDSPSTSSSNISEPHFGISSAPHTAAILPPERLDAKKKEPHWLPQLLLYIT